MQKHKRNAKYGVPQCFLFTSFRFSFLAKKHITNICKRGALRTNEQKRSKENKNTQPQQKTRKHKTHVTKTTKQGARKTNNHEQRNTNTKEIQNTVFPALLVHLLFVNWGFESKNTYHKNYVNKEHQEQKRTKSQQKQKNKGNTKHGVPCVSCLVVCVIGFFKKKDHKHM